MFSTSKMQSIKNGNGGVIWEVLALVTVVKLALIFSPYASTDFEVHRNWLAITKSLPLNEWYYENTSEWTLDYPPLFAWFEFFLAIFAGFFDGDMLKVQNLNYKSNETILFQKLSVILSDVVLAIGIGRCCHYLRVHRSRKSSSWKFKWRSPTSVLTILVLSNAGLLIVDHIHFQYNGVLLGLLLLSISYILDGQFVKASICYSVLLCMKHIFLYVAPVYLVYCLRNYCFDAPYKEFSLKQFSLNRFSKLAGIVASVVLIAFGPFIYLGQISQVLLRLFPFKRGLTHAYWAPNFWAIYNVADKALAKVMIINGFNVNTTNSSMCSGLVQEYSHSVLPSVTPKISLLLTVISILPCLWKLWSSPNIPLHFVRSIVVCCSCFFMFGWHVHEKAIIVVIVPMTIMSVLYLKEAKIFVLLCTVGHFSLLPLIPNYVVVHYIIFLIFSVYMFISLTSLFGKNSNRFSLPFLSTLESIYLLGLTLIFLYDVCIQHLLGYNVKYPFLNLLLTSVYCSIGILYSTSKYYYYFLFYDSFKFKSR